MEKDVLDMFDKSLKWKCYTISVLFAVSQELWEPSYEIVHAGAMLILGVTVEYPPGLKLDYKCNEYVLSYLVQHG